MWNAPHVSMQATGFRSEAETSQPRRAASNGLEDSLDKGGVDLNFPDHDLHSLGALSDSESDVFKAYGLLARLFETLEVGALCVPLGDAAFGFVRGIELAGGCFDAAY